MSIRRAQSRAPTDFELPRRSEVVDWRLQPLGGAGWAANGNQQHLRFNLLELATRGARMQLMALGPQPDWVIDRLRTRHYEDIDQLIRDSTASKAADAMRLSDPPAGWLVDFERTALTGRVGAAFAATLMASVGCEYQGPFEAVYGRKSGKCPDFVYLHRSGDRVLVESKGSFTNRTSTRGRAKRAAKEQVTPKLTEGYGERGLAIGSAPTANADHPAVFVYEITPVNSGPGGPSLSGSYQPAALADKTFRDATALFLAHWRASLDLIGFHNLAQALRINDTKNRRAAREELERAAEASADWPGHMAGPTTPLQAMGERRLQLGLHISVVDILKRCIIEYKNCPYHYMEPKRAGLTDDTYGPARSLAEALMEPPVPTTKGDSGYGSEIRLRDGLAVRLLGETDEGDEGSAQAPPNPPPPSDDDILEEGEGLELQRRQRYL